MDISTINNSNGLYFASLTSPFVGQKPVTINAYNAFKPATVASGSFSRDHFNVKPQVYNKININLAKNGMFKSSKNIVENSISAGMSPIEAVQMYKAHKAYGLADAGSTSGANRLSTGYYIV